MLLAIDSGNSFIKFALFDGSVLRVMWRRPNVPERGYAKMLVRLLDESGIDRDAVDAVVIGSVVPASTPTLVQCAADLFSVDAYIASSALRTVIDVDYDP